MIIGYSLDDILLEPQYSDVMSRLDTNIECNITTKQKIQVPIIATPMPSITEYEMIKALNSIGGTGVLHRFMPITEQVKIAKRIVEEEKLSIASVGVGDEELTRAKELISVGTKIIMIDVAHGHHKQVYKQIESIKKYHNIEVIAGNISSYEATKDLIEYGADGIRVGIGGGYACSTRLVTGHGIPNLTALQSAVRARNEYPTHIPILLDGGIKTSGCIVKALALGADAVTLGFMLAGTDECPGQIITQNGSGYKKYYGLSSKEAQDTHKGGLKQGIAAEGYSMLVPYRGSVIPILQELIGGIRSGLSYSGARTIRELQQKAKFILLSQGAQYESKLR